MLEYLDFLFLSYSGRIGRTSYWLSTLVLTIVEFAVIMLLLRLSGGTLAQLKTSPEYMTNDLLLHVFAPIAIITVLFLYPAYALATKRWHDRDKSGWWSLIGFVPIIGGFWMLIELGFLGGSVGGNSYGTR